MFRNVGENDEQDHNSHIDVQNVDKDDDQDHTFSVEAANG